MEKNKFFTFVYSFMPGAGYMYLNMMQVGVVAMILFFGIFGIAVITDIHFLLVGLPVIWFYTFFDTFHVAKMDLEERKEREKKMIEGLNKFLGGGFTEFIQEKKKVIGICGIFFGIYIIVTDLLFPLLGWIPQFDDYGFLNWISNRVPSLTIALLLLYGGNKLLKQERDIKKEEEEEELVAYQEEEIEKEDVRETKEISEE